MSGLGFITYPTKAGLEPTTIEVRVLTFAKLVYPQLTLI